MSNLLVITRRKFWEMEAKQKSIPLELHGAVPKGLGPYLVTKSKGGVTWVDEAPTDASAPDAPIRAGVCQAAPSTVFFDIVQAVADRGIEDDWGNVHPYSLDGVLAAADYVRSFDLTDIELLVPRIRLPKYTQPKVNKKLKSLGEALNGHPAIQEERPVKRPEWMCPEKVGMPICPTSWLPDGYAVVVPAERAFVGELTHLARGFVAAIVHNPSRGIAIARSVPK